MVTEKMYLGMRLAVVQVKVKDVTGKLVREGLRSGVLAAGKLAII
jgi:hypothetical protein